jgi:hypothetical protein
VSYFFILGDSSFPKILEPLTNFFEIKKIISLLEFSFLQNYSNFFIKTIDNLFWPKKLIKKNMFENAVEITI